jgi:hypothetical protein
MRGHDEPQESLFSYISPEMRVPLDHPLRRVREMTHQVLLALWPKFSVWHSLQGWPCSLNAVVAGLSPRAGHRLNLRLECFHILPGSNHHAAYPVCVVIQGSEL